MLKLGSISHPVMSTARCYYRCIEAVVSPYVGTIIVEGLTYPNIIVKP